MYRFAEVTSSGKLYPGAVRSKPSSSLPAASCNLLMNRFVIGICPVSKNEIVYRLYPANRANCFCDNSADSLHFRMFSGVTTPAKISACTSRSMC